jgi:hypothetical protein
MKGTMGVQILQKLPPAWDRAWEGAWDRARPARNNPGKTKTKQLDHVTASWFLTALSHPTGLCARDARGPRHLDVLRKERCGHPL